MILIRNQSGQYVELGPLRDASGAVITSGATAWINNATADGTLVHRGNGIWGYTFAQGETFGNTALRVQATGGSVCGNFAFLSSIDGLIVAHSVSNIHTIGLRMRYVQDENGNAHAIAQSGADDSVYQLDVSGIATTVNTIEQAVLQSNVATEVDSPTIKLKISTTKAKTHFVTGNLTGKTLKLYVESKPGTFFAEFTASGANGSFSFTPSSTLTQNIRTFPAALREPSDGNNVLWSGNIEVAYAADAE